MVDKMNLDACIATLFNSGPVIFFALKNETGYPFAFLSKNSESILGFDNNDIDNGLHLADIISKADRFSILTRLEDTVADKAATSCWGLCNIACKNGKKLWVNIFFAMSKDSEKTGNICGYIKDISEAQEMGARLGTILSTMPSGIIEMDTSCVIQNVNRAIEGIYGFKYSELIGKPISILMDDAIGHFVVDNFKMAAKTEALPTSFTHKHRRKNGEDVYVELAWGYNRDLSDRIKGFVCSISDVTDKKNAHDRLVQQVDFLHHIIESVANPFYVIDVQTMNVVVSNSAAGAVTGVKCYELLHHTSTPCFMEGYDCPYHRVLKDKKPVTAEHMHYDPDNQKLFYEIHGHPVFDNKGNVIQIIEYTQNITDRKKSESELERYRNQLEVLVDKRTKELNSTNTQLIKEIEERVEKERQLILAASVIENTIEGITITDSNGVIQKVNPAFTSITGYRADEAIGKTPRILKSDKHNYEFYHKMWTNITSRGNWSGEIWNRRKNGDAYPEWLSINAIKDASDKITHFVAIFHDISEVKMGEEKLKYQANHDTLTGLPNRQLFNDRLEMALAYARRHKQKVGVIFIDLDNFKNVNDTLGHYVGDILLQKVAEILKRCVRIEDTVARLGGDEFMVILQDISSEDNAVETARRILREFARPLNIHDTEFFISSSIGITIFPDDGEDVLTLVKNADLAMYRVKETGKSSYQLFTSSMNEKVLTKVSMERELRKAIGNNEFDVYYQPKVNLTTGRVTGAEALIRWKNNGKMIPPSDFIPVAEESGHIIAIGNFVLKRACEQAKSWHEMGFEDISVAVNLSARQFRDDNMLENVFTIIEESGADPHRINLEITENTVMEDIQTTIIALANLVEKGIQISIDDFGTGYSSLSYLKKFPISILKIDRSFIKDIPEDTDDMAISRTIISLAKGLNLSVVAEGVETKEQLDFCRENGCDELQGYYFSKPLNYKDFIALLKSGRTL